jgi:hypothetical protein
MNVLRRLDLLSYLALGVFLAYLLAPVLLG